MKDFPPWYLYFYHSVCHIRLFYLVLCWYLSFFCVGVGGACVPDTLWSRQPALIPCVVSLGGGHRYGRWMKFLLHREHHSDFIYGAICRTEGHFQCDVNTVRAYICIHSTGIICLIRRRARSGDFGGSGWRVRRHTKAPCCKLAVFVSSWSSFVLFWSIMQLWYGQQCSVLFS